MKSEKYIVYLHINKINGKVYVGITSYSNPSRRWSYGYKGNPHFQASLLRYGWDNFKHIVVFSNLKKETACRIEQLLILKYKKQKRCYNIANGGEGSSAMSEGTKDKLRQYKGPLASQYGKKHSKERVEQQRVATTRLWKEQREHRLAQLLKYGFKSGEEHPMYNKVRTEEDKIRISQALSKVVLMLDKKTGEILKEFNSATEAEDYLNAKGHHISCCCNNKRKTAYGYKWKYKEGG